MPTNLLWTNVRENIIMGFGGTTWRISYHIILLIQFLFFEKIRENYFNEVNYQECPKKNFVFLSYVLVHLNLFFKLNDG